MENTLDVVRREYVEMLPTVFKLLQLDFGVWVLSSELEVVESLIRMDCREGVVNTNTTICQRSRTLR